MRSRAFTLVELLVAIAILALLAAILFPVFAEAKRSVKKNHCLSNVYNLGIGFQLYIMDYDETWPLWSSAMNGAGPNTTLFRLENMYPGLVQSYIRSGVDTRSGALKAVWACPESKPLVSSFSNTYAYNYWTLGGYGECAGVAPEPECFNRAQALFAEYADQAYNKPALVSSVARPSETLALVDGAQLCRPPQLAIASPASDPFSVGVWGSHQLGQGGMRGPRGRCTASVVRQRLMSGRMTVTIFCDGHVKLMRTPQLYHKLYSAENGLWRGEREDNRYWSRDWARE